MLADKSEAGAARAGKAEGESASVRESDAARPSGSGEQLERANPAMDGRWRWLRSLKVVVLSGLRAVEGSAVSALAGAA